MSKISDIIDIQITRQITAITVAGFGTPGIIAEFAEDKTTTTFDRYRNYGDGAEMIDDGWQTTDEVYIRASKIFGQNPRSSKVMIGRKKPDSETVETWTEALTAIQNANVDWYTFEVQTTKAGTIVFDSDFVTSNLIGISVNGVAVTQVPFNTDQLTTMNALITQIETDITGAVAALDPADVNNRTLIIQIEEGDINALTAVVTGGALQPVATITITDDDDVLEIAAWAETQKKIFIHTSIDSNIPVSTDTDILSKLKDLSYDRTAIAYHPDRDTEDAYFAEGWMGVCLPKDPGSQTWMFKNIAGIPSYNLTSGERTIVLNKNGNIYTNTAGVNITEEGTVVSGEYIDIMRGVDFIEARMGERIFTELINVDKIPFTDAGISIIEGLVKEILDLGVRQGIITDDYTVTVPLAADVPLANKLARTLPDIKFNATLQGAIHKITIRGVVSV